ncbi:MAG: aldo/keto reductase [Candidatus Electryonea clarkiae]|nr:aldo/keto reductase [Candidatus Electryonea clarkiae]MDP8286931.1 aldo/keto reductase [Candidatus Electryonea clarkiae]
MKYTYLGRSGLRVSRICLGTMNMGHWTSEDDSQVIMNTAIEKGINFFDTANVYGGSKGRGTTEEYIGRWIKQHPGKRKELVLATKVYGPMSDEGINDRYLSAYHIRQACEDSLQRLQTDHIDLYQMHHVDRNTPWEEIWQAMEQLIREGKVLYVGTSNFAGWHIVQGNEIAGKRNTLGIVSEQSLYHLENRAIEAELIPACEEYEVGIIPWSPLGGGLLGGVLKKLKEGRRATKEILKRVEKDRSKLEQYEALCDELDERPADVALAWLLSNPAVTAPIVGPRTLEQFKENVEAVDMELSKDTLERLNDIWPGPGGPAPECYAW